MGENILMLITSQINNEELQFDQISNYKDYLNYLN